MTTAQTIILVGLLMVCCAALIWMTRAAQQDRKMRMENARSDGK